MKTIFFVCFILGFFFKWGEDSKVPFQTTSVSIVQSSPTSMEYRNPQTALKEIFGLIKD